jgi:serine/threonine-protein kinase
MEQSPQTPTQLKPGSPVDVVIATGTANVVVPDVFLADEATAQKRVRSALFVPVVINAYSSDVSVGNVVSQLPRAGDMAFTGSPLFVVVSMGPGMPGVVVPALVGKPHKVAASLLTSESIFPRTLIVDSASVAPDTVVDQTPAAGTILPVGSSVAISLTSP